MHVSVKALPETVQRALRAGGFNKHDIKVEAREAVSLQTSAGDGYRGLAIVINMATGEHRAMLGSWGGPNPFEMSAIDTDDKNHVIPVNGAAFVGVTGHRTWGTLYVRPDALPALLPAAPVATDRQRSMLAIFASLKSFARPDALRLMCATPEEVDALVAAGWLKRSASGAVQITTEGKNARGNANFPY